MGRTTHRATPVGRALAGAFAAALVSVCALSCAQAPEPAPPVANGVLAHLAEPGGLTLHALHPYPWDFDGEEGAFEDFHGYPILGTVPVDDRSRRDNFLVLVERGIETSDGRVAACFNPRHGLSIEKDGQVTDLVICFECLSMSVYVDGVEAASHLTSDRLEPRVTELFEAAGLTIHTNDE